MPSPPSATGTGTISPSKPAAASPAATQVVASVADRLPLNLSGATTTRSTMTLIQSPRTHQWLTAYGVGFVAMIPFMVLPPMFGLSCTGYLPRT